MKLVPFLRSLVANITTREFYILDVGLFIIIFFFCILNGLFKKNVAKIILISYLNDLRWMNSIVYIYRTCLLDCGIINYMEIFSNFKNSDSLNWNLFDIRKDYLVTLIHIKKIPYFPRSRRYAWTTAHLSEKVLGCKTSR